MRTHILTALAASVALAAAVPLAAQQTRPERTAFRETSTYDDVRGFLDSLQTRGAKLRIWELAKSPQGRSVPVVLVAPPGVTTPAQAHATGRPIVYLQANIHAGEVEGKEAAQMLLRDLTLGPLRPLAAKLILLVVPIYNADGNEDFKPGDVNRPGQNGPAVVGRNTNGQGLNLNRDYVKLEAPETRGSTALIERWSPDVFIDLHTTNGSYHGYALTWSPGLNANVTPASRFVRDAFLPEVQRRLRATYRIETFPYGNFRNQEADSLRQGWETYDGRARYGTNWAGLRGRLSILSEGYSNDPFETRIHSTYHFVHEILRLLVERRAQVKALTRPDLPRTPDSVAVRSTLAPPTTQKVIAEITRPDTALPAAERSGSFAHRVRTGRFEAIEMPVFDRFAATRTRPVPAGYLVPARLAHAVELLRAQGIRMTELPDGWRAPAGVFTVDSVAHAPTKFEGHFATSLEGAWGTDSATAQRGDWWYVPTAQPLGLFAAYLLEPESEDGLVTWNVLDDELAAGKPYPIYRLLAPLASAKAAPAKAAPAAGAR
jgi:hypothetical protein